MYSTLSQILADERCARVRQHLVSEANDESKLANDAVVSHVLVLEAGANEPGLHPHPLLLPAPYTAAEDTPLECGMCCVRRTISPLTIKTLNQIAASRDMTLNSILLGTLATQLRARSGQDIFAINQTYLGRRPDQMRAVGSYSGFVAMEFTFDDKTTGRPSSKADKHYSKYADNASYKSFGVQVDQEQSFEIMMAESQC